MDIFLNEKSLQGQFDDGNISQGINGFIAAITYLVNLKNKGTVYKSTLLFNEQAIKGKHLDAVLDNNGDLKRAFFANLKSAVKWVSVCSPDDNYIWIQEQVTNTSVSELSERKLQDNLLKGTLLNFSNSTYSEHSAIEIVKNGHTEIEVDCAHSDESLKKWLREHNLIGQYDAYDENSTEPPEDEQTILGDITLFKKTLYKNKGNRVYNRVGTNELWCIDNSESHTKGKPHLEVFDGITCKHMGTSIYNAIDIKVKFKRNRKINLSHIHPID